MMLLPATAWVNRPSQSGQEADSHRCSGVPWRKLTGGCLDMKTSLNNSTCFQQVSIFWVSSRLLRSTKKAPNDASGPECDRRSRCGKEDSGSKGRGCRYLPPPQPPQSELQEEKARNQNYFQA